MRYFSKKVHRITVRDEQSLDLLRELGVSKVPVEVTADPALGIRITWSGKELLEQAGVDLAPSKGKVGVSLRSWEGEQEYLPVLARVLGRLREQMNLQYVFFPFQTGCDEQVSLRVLGEVFKEGDALVSGRFTPEQVAAMLKEMDGVIAMRLHGIILSSLSCVPAFGLIYDPKVKHFMERAGLGEYSIPVKDIPRREEWLFEQLHCWLLRKEALAAGMKPRIAAMADPGGTQCRNCPGADGSTGLEREGRPCGFFPGGFWSVQARRMPKISHEKGLCMETNRITVIGLGFVGLPLSLSFAMKGQAVTGLDVNEALVKDLNRGITHCMEEYRGKPARDILRQSLEEGTFKATTSYQEAAAASGIFIVTVGLPVKEGSRHSTFLKLL